MNIKEPPEHAVPLLLSPVNRGGRNRTYIARFGDEHSTTELRPHTFGSRIDTIDFDTHTMLGIES